MVEHAIRLDIMLTAAFVVRGIWEIHVRKRSIIVTAVRVRMEEHVIRLGQGCQSVYVQISIRVKYVRQ